MARKSVENRQIIEASSDEAPLVISAELREAGMALLALLDEKTGAKGRPIATSKQAKPAEIPPNGVRKPLGKSDETPPFEEEENVPQPSADEDDGRWTLEPSNEPHLDDWVNQDVLDCFQTPGQERDEIAEMLAAFLLETKALAIQRLRSAIRMSHAGIVEAKMKSALAAIKEFVRTLESFLEHRAKIVPKKAISIDIVVGYAAKLADLRRIKPNTPEWELECIVKDIDKILAGALRKFHFQQARHEPELGHAGIYEIYRDLERGIILATKARGHILVNWQISADRYFDKTILETTVRQRLKKASEPVALSDPQFPVH